VPDEHAMSCEKARRYAFQQHRRSIVREAKDVPTLQSTSFSFDWYAMTQ
jgi:hypothetical protein